MKHRRRYPKEFKIAAVRQIEETGRDVRDIAFDLGLHHNTLYRWWLEEYRVSLFGQQLGTKVPISDKRLSKQWSLVEA